MQWRLKTVPLPILKAIEAFGTVEVQPKLFYVGGVAYCISWLPYIIRQAT